jgi:hypothetical protein
VTAPLPGQEDEAAVELVRALGEKATDEERTAVSVVLARLTELEVKVGEVELAEAIVVVRDAAELPDRLGKALTVVLREYDRRGLPPAVAPVRQPQRVPRDGAR